ncbi:hypothetical protein MKX01_034968 [Papaver californicum]|nr:hypothetical protein MKX01_034968 [Papaver californicum]
MSAREISIDHENQSPDEEIIDIKMLLKVLVESHANTRNEMMEILRSSTSNSKTDEGKEKIVQNPSASSDQDKQKGKNNANSSSGKQEIAQVPGDNDEYKQPSEAKEFLKNNPEAINQAITHDLGTTMHLAVYWNRKTKFVEEIVKLMTPKVLEYKICTNGNKALHTAASRGITEAAVMMKIVEYLYSVTRDEEPNSPFSGNDGARLICSVIDANFYGRFSILSCQTVSEIGYGEFTTAWYVWIRVVGSKAVCVS